MDTILVLLGTAGVNVAHADCRLTTPLHWAAVCNRPDVNLLLDLSCQCLSQVCRALAHHGAPLSARDMQGLTPIHYAQKKVRVPSELV